MIKKTPIENATWNAKLLDDIENATWNAKLLDEHYREKYMHEIKSAVESIALRMRPNSE